MSAREALHAELTRRIPEECLSFQFSRSSGPGGQNVNKVNTRVTLVFSLSDCPHLGDEEKRRLRRKLANRLSAEGQLHVTSQRFRTQRANRAATIERFFDLLTDALLPPVPRRPTRPTSAARRRRLRDKKMQGERKRYRRRSGEADAE